jgi:hypothetical protein
VQQTIELGNISAGEILFWWHFGTEARTSGPTLELLKADGSKVTTDLKIQGIGDEDLFITLILTP